MSVVSTALSKNHEFSKTITSRSSYAGNSFGILLVTGHGVHNDCHAGPFVQHRSRLHIRPKPANLRQVHIQSIEQLQENDLNPADLGENVTTEGIDLGKLGEGWRLRFELPGTDAPNGAEQDNFEIGTGVQEELRLQIRDDARKQGAVIRVTGLRNPCPQIDKFKPGLKERFIVRDAERNIIERKAGIMGVVERGGWVRAGMKIVVEDNGSIPKKLQPV